MAATSGIVEATMEFVRKELEDMDGSHDFHHILRVHKLALRLAKDEGLSNNILEVVELGALLHDVGDWKYTGSEDAGPDAAAAFLASQNYDPEHAALVVRIVRGVSYHTELGGGVEDADRLDAIGAIGIGRCFTYGGFKKRPLYDPAQQPNMDLSKEAYKTSNTPTINHFYEKLLRLKDLMKTKSGRALAEERHAYMLNFLDRFFAEWDARA